MNVNFSGRAFGVLCLFICIQANANNLHLIPLPQGVEPRLVANGAEHNGQKLYIKKFTSDLSPEDVIDFYRGRWASGTDVPGFMESSNHGWKMISRLRAESQWVVQVQASLQGRGSDVLVSEMNLNSSKNGLLIKQTKFTPPMRGGSLVSTTHSSVPTPARTQTKMYAGQVSTIADRFKRHALNHGWKFQDEFHHQNSMIQRFVKANQRLDIALVQSEHGKTMVFENESISSR